MVRPDYYTPRINLIRDYIVTHLTDDLSLSVLAGVAGFSPFHFHRIFKTITGENLNVYVVRRRLERAAALMKAAPEATLTTIALECGFDSLTDFSRNFRRYFGVSPGHWDRVSGLKNSKIRKAGVAISEYTIEQLSEIERTGEFMVELRAMPATPVACLRVTDPYSGTRVVDAITRLLDWQRHHLPNWQSTLIGMSQDDPDIVPLAQCTYDVCVQIPADCTIPVSGDMLLRTLPACTLAVISCIGSLALTDRVWQYLYRYWLPASRYAPDNLPAMEIYRRTPEELPWGEFDLDCCLPVIPLNDLPLG